MARGDSEARTIQQMADTMAGLLADAGVMTSALTDEDVVAGALSDYEFAIFPYNPVLKWITVGLVTGCLAGLLFSRPWWRGHSLLVAILVVQTAFYSLYHADIDNRFRLPLEPFLLMYGSALLWRLGGGWRLEAGGRRL